eukprot:jgi/Phyca11/103857/e_gw1.8.117.1
MERVLRRHNSVENAFKAFDRDGNNEMDFEQFRDFMGQYGITDEANEEDVASLMKKLDVDGDGCVDFEEFASIFHEARVGRHEQRKHAAFYQYDNDGNSELDHQEFGHFMKRYGIVKNDDIDTLIRRLDTDGSGTISFDEFSVIFNPL